MECCRICLTPNNLSNIFETEELASNITAIACVNISRDDGLPQYICLLCKHELDISINFKDKCETTFEMLKEQHSKEIEVKENIILSLLSGGNALDRKLPKRARESILRTVKNSVKNDMQNMVESNGDNEEYFLGEDDEDLIFEDGVVWEENTIHKEILSENNKIPIETKSQEDIESAPYRDNKMTTMLNADDRMTTGTDVDDQMTDITEYEIEIPESLSLVNQDLMCLKCNFCFVDEKCLFDHLTRMHSKTMGQCQICLLYFPTSMLLKDHLSSKHDVSDDNETLAIRYKICNKTFGLQSELNAHLCSDSGQKEFLCRLCESNFRTETHLENHIGHVHQRVEFTCDQRDEKFDHFDRYRQHLKDHSDRDRKIIPATDKEWNNHINSCITRKKFKRMEAENLTEMSNNHNHESFVCPLCEKCFKTNSMLQIHVRIHTGENPYKCMDCHKTFAQATALSVHQRIHNKSTKPHVCSICQMSFYKKNSLEGHLLQHGNLIKCTKEKIYISAEYEEQGDEEV